MTITSLNTLTLSSAQAVAKKPLDTDLGKRKQFNTRLVHLTVSLPADIIDLSCVVARQCTHTFPGWIIAYCWYT